MKHDKPENDKINHLYYLCEWTKKGDKQAPVKEGPHKHIIIS